MPDPDWLIENGIQGTNPNTPIIRPSDWGGWANYPYAHLHAPADQTRPGNRPDTGDWLMPPMQPAGEWMGGDFGSWNRYFFDGSSGAFPPIDPYGDFFGLGWKDSAAFMDRLGSVQTAIDAVGNVLSSMPLYGHKNEQQVKLPEWSHNPDPDTYESVQDALKQIVTQVLGRGEVFLWATARYSNGYPSRFVCLNPSWIGVTTDGNGRRVYHLGDDRLDSRDVLHIRYSHSPGELHGVGPLEWMARTLVGNETLHTYVDSVAKYGVPAILNNPAGMDARQAADLKSKFLASRRVGEPVVLSGGITYQDGAGALSPESLAAVDMIHTNEAKLVAAICQTPPYIVGVEQPGGSMTYSNLHQLTSGWWRIGLRPLARKITSAMSSWLLPYGTAMELNRDEFVRPADPAMLAQYYSTMANIQDADGYPALTVNEIRVAERFTPHYDAHSPGNNPDAVNRFEDALDLSGGRTQ